MSNTWGNSATRQPDNFQYHLPPTGPKRFIPNSKQVNDVFLTMQWSNNCAPISPTQLSERFKSCNPVLISNAAAIRAIPSIFPVKSVMLLDEKSNLVNVLQPPQMKKNTTTGREETKKSMRGSRTHNVNCQMGPQEPRPQHQLTSSFPMRPPMRLRLRLFHRRRLHSHQCKSKFSNVDCLQWHWLNGSHQWTQWGFETRPM